MKKFTEFKNDFIERCKQHSACRSEFKRVLESQNESELLQVVFDNFNWCYVQEKIIDVPWLLTFTKKVREEIGMYVNHKTDRLDITKNCYVISNDSSNIGEVRSYGSSNIGYVISYDSSNIGEVRSYDSSNIGYVRSYDSSNIGYVRSYGSSNIGEVISNDSSNIGEVISYDSSNIGEVISYDSSNIGYVRSYDSSNITINGVGNAKIIVDGAGSIKSLSDYKIYIKKDKFTIHLID